MLLCVEWVHLRPNHIHKRLPSSFCYVGEQTIRETALESFPDHDFLGEEDVAPGKDASAAALDSKLSSSDGDNWLWIVGKKVRRKRKNSRLRLAHVDSSIIGVLYLLVIRQYQTQSTVLPILLMACRYVCHQLPWLIMEKSW